MAMNNQRDKKDPIHGNIYQLKLLMLFLYRGVTRKYNFLLGTEIQAAKKFDDLVFQYTEGNTKFYRLLQAKHFLDENKKITCDSLFTDSDSPFSLIKYFFSYQESKNEGLFKGGTIKDIILCTNINFDKSDLEKKKINTIPITETDAILDMKTIKRGGGHQTMRYKFDHNVADKLHSALENYIFSRLAQELTDCILNNKMIAKNNKIFEKHQKAFIKEVIDVKSKKLHINFLNNQGLSKNAEIFRDTFRYVIRKESNNQITLENINDAIDEQKIINGKKIGLTLRKDFGTGREDDNWPEIVISKYEVEDFLSRLVFAVHQLNEDELGQEIKTEIGNQFNNITTEFIYYKIFDHMLCLLQGKDHDGNKTAKRFFSYAEGKRLINDTRKQILNYLKPDCKDELAAVPFHFRPCSKVHNFISSANNLWILPSETPWLSSLVLYQSVECNAINVTRHFFYCKDLNENDLRIISDFQEFDDFLMIVTCMKTIGGDEINSEFIAIIENMLLNSNCNWKKVIIVASLNPECKRLLKLKFDRHQEIELKIGLFSMTDDSREELFKKENIAFNGIPEKRSLNQILCSAGQASLTTVGMRRLNLNAQEIELILRSSHIEVWNEFPDHFSLSSVNYKANKKLNFHEIIYAITYRGNDIFAFVGDGNKICKFFPMFKLQKFRYVHELHTDINNRFFLLDYGRETEQFQQLCRTADNCAHLHFKYVHKLKFFGENEWIWMETYSQMLYIPRYFKPHIISRNVMKLLAVPNSSEFVLFSGLSEKKMLSLLRKDRLVFKSLCEGFGKRNCKIVISERDAEIEFNNLQQFVDQYTDNSISRKKGMHWLKTWEEEGNLKLEWYKSFGNVSKMGNLLINQDDFLLFEDDLIRSKRRFVILADEPGMGKTSTLRRLAEVIKKSSPMSMVTKIDLNKDQCFLTSHSVNMISQFVDLLFRIKPKLQSNTLTRRILEYKLKYSQEVILLFDGFDEVTQEKQHNVLELFKFIIDKTNASIWVTTRVENKHELENFFCVLSYQFATLNKFETVEYLSNIWNIDLSFSGINQQCFDIDRASKHVIEHFSRVLKTEFGEMFKIPLILRMVAEMFTKFINSIFLKNIQDDYFIQKELQKIYFLDIYERFVNNMYEIYLMDKAKIGECLDDDSLCILKNSYTKAYGRLALKYMGLFEDFAYLGKQREKLTIKTLSKIGFVQMHTHRSTFIHPSFKEYFAIEIICSKLKSNSEAEPFWEILLDELFSYNLCRKLFDDRLERDNGFFDALTGRSQMNIVYNLLLDQVVSDNGQVALWTAAYHNMKRTVSFFAKCMTTRLALSNLLPGTSIPSKFKNDDDRILFIIEIGKTFYIKRELHGSIFYNKREEYRLKRILKNVANVNFRDKSNSQNLKIVANNEQFSEESDLSYEWLNLNLRTIT